MIYLKTNGSTIEHTFCSVINITGSQCSMRSLVEVLNHINAIKEDITTLSERELTRLMIGEYGYIYQNLSLFDGMTLKENISVAMAQRMTLNEANEYLSGIADKLNILGNWNKHPYMEISKSVLQRCACARAIVSNSDFIVTDEPEDHEEAIQLIEILKLINIDYGKAILLVTKGAESASYFSRVLILKDDRIIKDLCRNGRSRSEFCDMITNIIKLNKSELKH